MSNYQDYSHCTLIHAIHERDNSITRLELLLSERDAEIKRLRDKLADVESDLAYCCDASRSDTLLQVCEAYNKHFKKGGDDE